MVTKTLLYYYITLLT